MSVIANAPLWFHIGAATGGLLLTMLSLIATKRLSRPDVGLALSYVTIITGVTMMAIVVSHLV